MDNVRRELEPGLGISRLSRDDYLRFLRLGAFFTAYVRGKQVLSNFSLLSLFTEEQPIFSIMCRSLTCRQCAPAGG